MEVKIGVQNAPRELLVESNQSAEDVAAAVSVAFTKDEKILSLTDERGRQVLIPTAQLAYVEIGEPESRKVGFGAL